MSTQWHAMLNHAEDEGSASLRERLGTGAMGGRLPDAEDASRIPIGWVPLVLELLAELQARGWSGHPFTAKEKLGELRFDSDELRGELERPVQEAQAASTRVCQVCGHEGRTRRCGGRVATVCERHLPSGASPIASS